MTAGPVDRELAGEIIAVAARRFRRRSPPDSASWASPAPAASTWPSAIAEPGSTLLIRSSRHGTFGV